MASILDQLPESSRVAIIRLRSLGDCVLTTPALQLLAEHRPDLHISVVVEDRFARVFTANPHLKAILPPKLSAVAALRPSLTVNLHGGSRSIVLTTASAARFRAGFAHHKGACSYNVRIPRAQQILGEERTVHTVEHLASAMFHLGVPLRPIPRASLFCAPAPPGRPYAVLHPVAATPEKTWPAERFSTVAGHLAADGLEPVFIGGPGDDLTPFARFRTLAGAPLEAIKTLLRGASLFIGNDSGPAHMAAAFGLPVVVLFGPSDPVIWAPWRTESQVLASPSGIGLIDIRQVLEAIERLRVAQ